MTKRPRVVVCGWYGASNIGDELLLGVVHAWVRELGGELTIVSLNPEHTARTYATAAVDFLNLGDIARALADSDLFVMDADGRNVRHDVNVQWAAAYKAGKAKAMGGMSAFLRGRAAK